MFRNLTAKWVSPAAAVVITLGVVLAVSALPGHSAAPVREVAAPQAHQVAAPAAAKGPRFTLVTASMGSLVFTELVGITTQVEPNVYLTDDGTPAPSKQYGKTKPPIVTLRRAMASDTAAKKVFTWHTLARNGNPTALVDAKLVVTNAAGATTMTYHLLSAWPSKLDIGGLNSTTGDVSNLTVTLSCDEIIAE